MSEDYLDYRLIRDSLADELEEIIVDGALGEQIESICRACAVLSYPIRMFNSQLLLALFAHLSR
ncbi:protein of unknown function [Limnospira indica PCC 8005]|uniref:Uncharacterized protein n=1 Tax=Limnospira indica PCC 8005 TaxID=376219 RepID=A0A9P1KFP1_9CYAN|nr:protein of unknown function [Limnospira indica PCC 8005]